MLHSSRIWSSPRPKSTPRVVHYRLHSEKEQVVHALSGETQKGFVESRGEEGASLAGINGAEVFDGWRVLYRRPEMHHPDPSK